MIKEVLARSLNFKMKIDNNLFAEILKESEKIINGSFSRDNILKNICHIIYEKLDYYNWVGFYLVESENKLILGPYLGEPTEHKEIKFGEGICGQVAIAEETFIIDNVHLEENYLSCSPKVKSEIVVPVYKDSKFVAEMDIDSYTESAFNNKDKNFLENLTEMLSSVF